MLVGKSRTLTMPASLIWPYNAVLVRVFQNSPIFCDV